MPAGHLAAHALACSGQEDVLAVQLPHVCSFTRCRWTAQRGAALLRRSVPAPCRSARACGAGPRCRTRSRTRCATSVVDRVPAVLDHRALDRLDAGVVAQRHVVVVADDPRRPCVERPLVALGQRVVHLGGVRERGVPGARHVRRDRLVPDVGDPLGQVLQQIQPHAGVVAVHHLEHRRQHREVRHAGTLAEAVDAALEHLRAALERRELPRRAELEVVVAVDRQRDVRAEDLLDLPRRGACTRPGCRRRRCRRSAARRCPLPSAATRSSSASRGRDARSPSGSGFMYAPCSLPYWIASQARSSASSRVIVRPPIDSTSL